MAITWFFSSARAGEFYRYWIKRAKNIEKELKYPNLYRGIDEYFDKLPFRKFYTRVPVITASWAIPLSFLLLFSGLPFIFFGFGCIEQIALVFNLGILILFIVWGNYQVWKYKRKNKG